jgi:hypothetical protein
LGRKLEKRRTRKIIKVLYETEIWQVTHVTEEDLETTECEEVDLLTALLELEGWERQDKE